MSTLQEILKEVQEAEGKDNKWNFRFKGKKEDLNVRIGFQKTNFFSFFLCFSKRQFIV